MSHARFLLMGQRINAEDLREMLRVARKLRNSAQMSDDASYTGLFTRAAAALEERAAQLAYHPSDLDMAEADLEEAAFDPALYRHVDFRC
jgi:hypothetical protein